MSTEIQGLDLSQIASEYERVSSESNSKPNEDYLEKFVRLPEKSGHVTIRFMPIKKNEKFYCVTRIHTLSNPNTKRKKAYHCRRELTQTDRGPRWMGDCIICKYYSDLWQKSEGLSGKAQEDMQNQARAIKPVERYYYNVIVRQQKNSNGEVENNVGPKIYSCGKSQHAKITRAIVGDDIAGEPALGDITNPKNGRDFRVVKKIVKGGGGMEYPNYDDSKFEDPTPLGSKEEIVSWLENSHDLQALRQVKDPEELKHALRVHLGMVEEGETSDELEEFRNPTVAAQPKQEVVTASAEIEEDKISVATPVAQESSDEDELLADDDFMRELGAM